MYEVDSDSTQHGLETPHGLATPHKLPGAPQSTPVNFFKMVELLYPTGRAWELPEGGNFTKFHSAINLSLLKNALDSAASIDSTFPDNEGFDSDDCTLWENRFGIPYNAALTTAQRRTNIYNFMAFPQNILGRQSPGYIEYSLQQAGFDVHIYQNIFFDGGGHLYQKTPQQVLGTGGAGLQFGGTTQFGGTSQFGGQSYSVIANQETSENYSTGGILWPTFFISGDTIDTPANISQFRETEFRRAVLKLKPAHTVAFLIVNFV